MKHYININVPFQWSSCVQFTVKIVSRATYIRRPLCCMLYTPRLSPLQSELCFPNKKAQNDIKETNGSHQCIVFQHEKQFMKIMPKNNCDNCCTECDAMTFRPSVFFKPTNWPSCHAGCQPPFSCPLSHVCPVKTTTFMRLRHISISNLVIQRQEKLCVV